MNSKLYLICSRVRPRVLWPCKRFTVCSSDGLARQSSWYELRTDVGRLVSRICARLQRDDRHCGRAVYADQLTGCRPVLDETAAMLFPSWPALVPVGIRKGGARERTLPLPLCEGLQVKNLLSTPPPAPPTGGHRGRDVPCWCPPPYNSIAITARFLSLSAASPSPRRGTLPVPPNGWACSSPR